MSKRVAKGAMALFDLRIWRPLCGGRGFHDVAVGRRRMACARRGGVGGALLRPHPMAARPDHRGTVRRSASP